MFDKSHFVVSEVYNPKGAMERFLHLKRIMDQKCAANLRLLATKNNINRASDYHYLNLAVTQSTEPVNGIDYIHPVVKPNVDYSTAVISKGLMSNGEINFEFVADNEDDATAAQQATHSQAGKDDAATGQPPLHSTDPPQGSLSSNLNSVQPVATRSLACRARSSQLSPRQGRMGLRGYPSRRGRNAAISRCQVPSGLLVMENLSLHKMQSERNLI